MKKTIIAIAASVPILLLSSCTINTTSLDTVVYNPGYSNDYVYSVGYYNNRPYWGNNYYYVGSPNYIYSWGDNGYWGGGFYNGY